MRLKSLFLSDLRFQAKYGFYFLYAVLTVVYIVILFALPESWREKAAAIFIFSDPAAMGLFFMGAIVLFEKNQHMQCAFAASPVRAWEYITAKVGSLSAVSLAVAALLALAAKVNHFPVVLLGTAIASVAFTLSGLIIATKITGLNQFILWTLPLEAACFVPAILHLFKITPARLRLYPANICMEMIAGSVPCMAGVVMLLALLVILFSVSNKCVLKMWENTKGVKL